jgi:serine/threonine-protein kinase
LADKDLEPLAQLMRRGPVPVTQAVKIAIRIAEQLSDAHRSGRAQANLHPGNVFYRHVGNDLTVALLEPGDARNPTPAPYLAPEGTAGEIGSPADVYALGALLHHMIGGRVPRGDRPASLASTLQEIPPELDDLVQQMLARSPRARPASADEVRERLENLELDSTVMGEALASLREGGELDVHARPAHSVLEAPTVEVDLLSASSVGPSPEADPYGETFIRPPKELVSALRPGDVLLDADATEPPSGPIAPTPRIIARRNRAPEVVTEAGPLPTKPWVPRLIYWAAALVGGVLAAALYLLLRG